MFVPNIYRLRIYTHAFLSNTVLISLQVFLIFTLKTLRSMIKYSIGYMNNMICTY